MKRLLLAGACIAAFGLAAAKAQDPAALVEQELDAASRAITFPLTVSPGARICLRRASGFVVDRSLGRAELMTVTIAGLPPNTEFSLFSLQAPNAPFGLAWHIGALKTNASGVASGQFIGRFNRETFVVSPGAPNAPPPNTYPSPPAVVPQAGSSVQTKPVQLYHLGIWFNSAADAQRAGCPSTPTPFNGVHNAGVQALNTGAFPDARGPLFYLN